MVQLYKKATKELKVLKNSINFLKVSITLGLDMQKINTFYMEKGYFGTILQKTFTSKIHINIRIILKAYNVKKLLCRLQLIISK